MSRRVHPQRSRQLIRDESGVIAIIVALSISTFLLGFAALAVDLGMAYVRKAELKATAEKVALAGAADLPDVSDALDSAISTLGTSAASPAPGTGLCATLDLPGVCDAAPGWANDGDDANGEITFYADEGQSGGLADLNSDGTVTAADKVSGDEAVGIRVLLPPSRVPFGLAGSLGIDSADVTQTATARIGTPLGAGILPFALTQADVDAGQFCVQDPSVSGATGSTPPPSSGAVFLDAPAGRVQNDQEITVRLFSLFFPEARGSVRIHFENLPGDVSPEIVTGGYRVKVPEGTPGSTIRVWATGVFRFTNLPWVSTTDTLTYDGTLPTGTDPCAEPGANRGFVQLARTAAGDTLEANLRSGPEARLYSESDAPGAIGSTTDCLPTVLTSPPATSCLATVLDQSFATRMTDGFFTSSDGRQGRLIGDCGEGTDSAHGFSGIDDAELLETASPLVDTDFGLVSQLKSNILSGTTYPDDSKRGWVRSRALTCPRLALMPIVDPASLVSAEGGNRITGFTYVWIDDDGSERGLRWGGSNRLRAFRGYVISPALLPPIVAGSPAVGPYLGPDLPKEALLIRDLPA
jgi:Flp pilus assembly protein TadG